MFMHGNMTHILFNMFALWMFGTQLEGVLGKSRFTLFYFACGIGAALIYTAINKYQFNEVYSLLANSGLNSSDINSMIQQQVYPPKILTAEQAGTMLNIYHAPMVGASGAIYGVLVAYACYFPNAKLMLIFIPYPIAAKYFVPALIALDLFSGVTGFSLFGGGVAHFAHVGGAIIGFLLMLFWRSQLKKDESMNEF
jgi:membrane associated rhomboid family serine protease